MVEAQTFYAPTAHAFSYIFICSCLSVLCHSIPTRVEEKAESPYDVEDRNDAVLFDSKQHLPVSILISHRVRNRRKKKDDGTDLFILKTVSRCAPRLIARSVISWKNKFQETEAKAIVSAIRGQAGLMLSG